MKPSYLLSALIAAALLLAGCVQPPAQVSHGEATASLQPLQDAASAAQQEPSNYGERQGKTSPAPAEFSCENDESVSSRGYVLLMGLADHRKEGWVYEKGLMEKDPKARFALVYDQDENSALTEISEKFLVDMHALLKEKPVGELVLFGASAGGVTASHAISRLNFSGPVALHTLSSPLKGYGLTGARAAFIGGRTGYLRDVAVGFSPFDAPGKNVKAYHHKTVTDTVLKAYCGGLADFCDVHEIQNNNLRGSKEFYYPQYDHNPLMRAVIPRVLKCYNSGLDVSGNAEGAPALGDMCVGEQACNVFCKDNFGRCKQYCRENPSNPLCQKPFAFEQNKG